MAETKEMTRWALAIVSIVFALNLSLNQRISYEGTYIPWVLSTYPMWGYDGNCCPTPACVTRATAMQMMRDLMSPLPCRW